MTDQHADVPTRPRLDHSRAQAAATRLGLQTRGQQIPFVQGQAGTRRVQPLGRKPLQALQPLAHFILRPEYFATGMQHARPVVMGQGLE